MLPKTYFGSQKNILIDIVIYALLMQIHSIWKDIKASIVLFLNITGIFNNVLHKQLLYNLHKQNIYNHIISLI